MPLGFERLNERQQRPNPLINFIKPLDGPDKATSEEFLSRIAAQCYPIMKKHYITVMALEEYEPNPEFLGRNFNAGEVIQLVLKDKQGRWLSMKFVQMVMMHELAHCKQMNHSRFFWTVRNDYAKQMEDLWKDNFTGEGLWGRGRGLANGELVNAAPPDNTQIPEHLCGGSYRRRGRKRKRVHGDGQEQPEKLSYAERQRRRIARKFGKHGDGSSLGEDELLRGGLETMNGGKRGQGKPKVANSKRGRELRAAAALARFEQAKRDTPEQTPELVDDSETESDWEEDAATTNGMKNVIIRDGKGRDLVKVCGDGEDDEEGAGKEMDELRMLSAAPKGKAVPQKRTTKPARGQEGHEDSETESETEEPPRSKKLPTRKDKPVPTSRTEPPGRGEEGYEDSETEGDDAGASDSRRTSASRPASTTAPPRPRRRQQVLEDSETDSESQKPKKISRTKDVNAASRRKTDSVEAPEPDSKVAAPPASSKDTASAKPNSVTAPVPGPSPLTDPSACPVCSLENELSAPTCAACANVLRPKLVPNSWRCKSKTCKDSKYVNPGDAGRCGLCGGLKPATSAVSESASGRPMGITRPEFLRWD